MTEPSNVRLTDSSAGSNAEAQQATFPYAKLNTVKRLTEECRNLKQTATVICLIWCLGDVHLSTIYQAHVCDKAMQHVITACSLSHKRTVCKFILILSKSFIYQLMHNTVDLKEY
jgi:hypothetical protein